MHTLYTLIKYQINKATVFTKNPDRNVTIYQVPKSSEFISDIQETVHFPSGSSYVLLYFYSAVILTILLPFSQ